MNVSENVALLEKYAYYEGTELGEYWSNLVSLYDRVDMMTEDFQRAVELEIFDQAKFARENFRLVTRTRSETSTRTITELLFQDEE